MNSVINISIETATFDVLKAIDDNIDENIMDTYIKMLTSFPTCTIKVIYIVMKQLRFHLTKLYNLDKINDSIYQLCSNILDGFITILIEEKTTVDNHVYDFTKYLCDCDQCKFCLNKK